MDRKQQFFVDSTRPHSQPPKELGDGRLVEWSDSGDVVITLTDGTTHRYAPKFHGSGETNASEGGHAYAILDGTLQVQSYNHEAFFSDSKVSGTDWETGRHGYLQSRETVKVLRTYSQGAWVEATGATAEPIHETRRKKTFQDDPNDQDD